MPPGTPVTLCIGAANRDPAQFADPERFDIGRTPNRHLAFGFGIHHCAGLALARLEGAIAIARFLARFPDYALAGEPVRGGRARFRGFLSVPCAGRRRQGQLAAPSVTSLRAPMPRRVPSPALRLPQSVRRDERRPPSATRSGSSMGNHRSGSGNSA